ncbi:MAG: hypothetical protein ACOC1G_06710, partial [Phycisphaeraceae bacterium]
MNTSPEFPLRLIRFALSASLLAIGLHMSMNPTHAAPASEPSHADGFDVPRLEGIEIDGRVDDWGEAGFRIDLLHR